MRIPLLAAGLTALALSGCNSNKSAQPAQGECSTADDCPQDKQCIDTHCIQVDCTTSVDCPFESYCDLANYACIDGCQEDSDCLSGEACDQVAATCAPAECQDTQLDCDYGQYCDAASGHCKDDTRPNCQACDATNSNPNQCPAGTCYILGSAATCTNSSTCATGETCSNIPGYGKICHADFCLETCNPNVSEPCPRGYECLDASGLGDYVCYADCVYMANNGYL